MSTIAYPYKVIVLCCLVGIYRANIDIQYNVSWLLERTEACIRAARECTIAVLSGHVVYQIVLANYLYMSKSHDFV